jgi:two-component system response regulator PilR (NtrC family)
MAESKDNQQRVRRILIVEDEATLSFFLAYSLMSEAEDYEVITARDAETAMAKMQEKPFDVIITDIVLPQSDGLSLLREIREDWSQCKVIVMTAYGSPEVRNRAQQNGAFAYVEKPFVYSKMRDLVIEALQTAAAPSPTE